MNRNIDFESAKRYLSILAPAENHFTFQTFDDRKRGSIAPRQFHGLLEQYSEKLMEENHNGAGVFVAMNETNLKGRDFADMVAPRALWIEADGQLPTGLPLLPSVTTETSDGRHHVIFAISNLRWDAFDRGMPILANRFGGDLNAIDRARVLRLPGFLHRKKDPHMVRIVDELTSGRSYSAEEFVDAFDIPGAPVRRARESRGRVRWNGSQDDFDKIASALRAIEAACQANGGEIVLRTEGHQEELIRWADRRWWLKVGLCLHHFFGGSDAGYSLWVAASGGALSLGLHGCPEKFDPHDQRRNWESFSSPSGSLGAPSRWRTIATIFWAARRCGWRQVGRPFGVPKLPSIHPSNDAVVGAGKAAVALGLVPLLQAHDEQAQLRYGGGMLKLVKGLLERVDPQSGIGQVPPLQTVARDLATTEGTVRSYLNRLNADGLIVKSNGAGRAHKAKGIAYAFTTGIITPTVANCYDNASTTMRGIVGQESVYPEEVKTILYADGGNGIHPWIEHGALLPPIIVDRIHEAQDSGRAEKTIKHIAQELWHLLISGLDRPELENAVNATYDDFIRIAASRARQRGRIKGAERLDPNSLTASKYLHTFLRALGRYSLANGIMSPEAQRIAQGRRKAEERKRAQIARGSLAYLTAKDPDYAQELSLGF